MTGEDVWTDLDVLDSIFVFAVATFSNNLIGGWRFSANQDYSNIPLFDSDGYLFGFFDQLTAYQNNSQNILVLIGNGGDITIPVNQYYWLITFSAKNSERIDTWIAIPLGSQYQIYTLNPRFTSDNFMTIGSPAVAKSVVSVGSYVTKNSFINVLGNLIDYSNSIVIGQISPFYSRGLSRDGRILASGEWVFSARSSQTNIINADTATVDISGTYVGIKGTSMSAPHVTGAIALLLHVTQNLNYSQVIELVKKAGSEDAFTGNLPNNNAGWWKLDVLRLMQFITSVEIKSGNLDDARLSPNPTRDFAHLISNKQIENIEIVDLFDRSLDVRIEKNVIDMSANPNGVYYVKARIGNETIIKHLIKF